MKSFLSGEKLTANLDSFDAGFSLELKKPDIFLESIKRVLLFDNDEFLRWSQNVKEYFYKNVDSDRTIQQYKSFFTKLADKR